MKFSKNSSKGFNKGFTLIELLVVIAIIGILSAVVLASLSTARLKSKDAAVIEQMASMRSQAELFYSSHGNSYAVYSNGRYNNSCNSSYSGDGGLFLSGADDNGLGGFVTSIRAIVGNANIKCFSTNNNRKYWIAVSRLPSDLTGGDTWCVDSLGNSATSSQDFFNSTLSDSEACNQ